MLLRTNQKPSRAISALLILSFYIGFFSDFSHADDLNLQVSSSPFRNFSPTNTPENPTGLIQNPIPHSTESFEMRNDIAGKSLYLFDNIQSMDPISQGKELKTLEAREIIERLSPSLDQEAKRRFAEGVGRVWARDAKLGRESTPLDVFMEAATETARQFKDLGKLENRNSLGTSFGNALTKEPGYNVFSSQWRKDQDILKTARRSGMDLSVSSGSFFFENTLDIVESSVRNARTNASYAEDLTSLIPSLRGANLANHSVSDLMKRDPNFRKTMSEISATHANQKGFDQIEKTIEKESRKTLTLLKEIRRDYAEGKKQAIEAAKAAAEKEKIIADRERISGGFDTLIASMTFASLLVSDPELRRGLKTAAVVFGGLKTILMATNPLTALNGLNNLVGALEGLFGGPNINETILQEIRELRKLVKEMYQDMMDQFGHVRDEIRRSHERMDARLADLETKVKRELLVQRQLHNEQSQVLSEMRQAQQSHADSARAIDYRNQMIPMDRARYIFKKPVTGSNALTKEEFEESYRAFSFCAGQNCTHPAFTGGTAPELSGDFASPTSMARFGLIAPTYWKTPAIIGPIQSVCTAAGNQICDSELANQTAWIVAASAQLKAAEQRPPLYEQVHEQAIVEKGVEVKKLPHEDLFVTLRRGRDIQEAMLRLAWKTNSETGEKTLNREFLNKLTDAYHQQVGGFETFIRERQDLMLPEFKKVMTWMESDQFSDELLKVAIPDALPVCNRRDVPNPVKVEVSAAQKIELLKQIPKEVLILRLLKKGEITFCVDPKEYWENPSEEKKITKSELSGFIYNARYDSTTFEEVTHKAKPAFVIKADLQLDSRRLTFMSIKLVGAEPIVSKVTKKTHYFRDGNEFTAQDGRGMTTDWDQTIQNLWTNGEFPSLLFRAKGSNPVLRIDTDVDQTGMNLAYFQNELSNRMSEQQTDYLKQLEADVNSNSPTVRAGKTLLAIEGSKALVERIAELGYEPLLEENGKFQAALSRLPGMHSLTADFAAKKADLIAPKALARFLIDYNVQSDELNAAFENGLRDLEKKSIADFTKVNIGTADELALKYLENYHSTSEVARVGRIKVVDAQSQAIETFLIEKLGEETKKNIESEHRKLYGGISSNGVWGNPSKLPSKIKPCLANSTDQAVPVDAAVRTEVEEKMKRTFTTEQWIAYRIGMASPGVCWKREANKIDYTVSWVEPAVTPLQRQTLTAELEEWDKLAEQAAFVSSGFPVDPTGYNQVIDPKNINIRKEVKEDLIKAHADVDTALQDLKKAISSENLETLRTNIEQYKAKKSVLVSLYNFHRSDLNDILAGRNKVGSDDVLQTSRHPSGTLPPLN